jgi:hypothetical protein
VCRGAREPNYPLCYPCGQNQRRAAGVLADAVVPISYSPDDGQHYHQLKVYKSPTSPNRLAQLRLAVLHTALFKIHRGCLHKAAGGAFTHVAVVASTRQRAGIHPLQQMITSVHPQLPVVTAAANPRHGNSREFHRDRFGLQTLPEGEQPARVLLVEDLWVTGARAQSMAHALKRAGASSVVVLALGRHINRTHTPSRPILDTAQRTPFDLHRCALDDLRP